jgi:hypothetical protein
MKPLRGINKIFHRKGRNGRKGNKEELWLRLGIYVVFLSFSLASLATFGVNAFLRLHVKVSWLTAEC